MMLIRSFEKEELHLERIIFAMITLIPKEPEAKY
jgi:hypothetical protein